MTDNPTPTTQSPIRELELGSINESLSVDIDESGSNTVVCIDQAVNDSQTGQTVTTRYEMPAHEARMVLKTIQDALERNNERNVVGYPARLNDLNGGSDNHATVRCPQCGEHVTARQNCTCSYCGTQIELRAAVTAVNSNDGSVTLPPR
jgi:hypothetical protein